MEEKAWKVAGIEDSFKPEKRKECDRIGRKASCSSFDFSSSTGRAIGLISPEIGAINI